LLLFFKEKIKYISKEVKMDRGNWHFRQGALLCILVVVSVHLWGLKVYGSELAILAPNGGEIIPSGSNYIIDWNAPPEAENFKLRYSLNNGKDWKTIEKSIVGTTYAWAVPTPTKNKNKCLVKITGYNTSGEKVGADKSDAPFTIEVMNITAPIGGEILPSGVNYDVTWDTNGIVNPIDHVKLFCSMDKGGKWKLLSTVAGNPGVSTCAFPIPTKNEEDCLVKVVAYDDTNQKVATDISDSLFTIEVVKLTSPDGGEILKSGGTHIITWTINETKRELQKLTLSYTQNGGKKWEKIKTELADPGYYYWLVPDVPTTKRKCKVKLALKDANGKKVGADTSDAYFTIEQDPFVFADVVDNDNPILAVATDDVDAIGVLGDRDFAGNPTKVTGIVYLFDQGETGTGDVGPDGLPTLFTDSSNNRVVFENYTEDTVDITLYDFNGDPVEGPVTVDVDPEDLATIRALYNQALDIAGPTDCEIHNRLTHALMYASQTSSWAGCVIYTAVGELFNGSIACFSALVGNIAALTNEDADDVFSFLLDGALCAADPISCLAALSTEAAPLIGECADIGGSWGVYEEGWVKWTVWVNGISYTDKETFAGYDTTTITQEDCSIKWIVQNEKRKGEVNGNKLTASGRLMIGGSGINFTKNKLTFKGLVCGDEIYLKATGDGAGQAFFDGAWYDFSCKVKSTGSFTREGAVSGYETTAEKEKIPISPSTMIGIFMGSHDFLKIPETDGNQ
jgi:hypothetical protein